ncbi:het-domain-containing protein [Fusarium pseudoanthophilum]|uniref:Het-domain-containing protein n=1 Tax=Fusarium pseudoanthophilum TaxID=48495 RepID=A0A8H5UNB4_9HYPO|nr:het-domain-containing protein [Fusarium pseudoanthophilum]
MRLLHTGSYRLFDYFNDEVPAYAILSHTWGRGPAEREVTFEDIRDSSDPTTIPNFDKIRDACSLAQSENHEYIWIDTCCIDKSSSSELSEAINSMYLWYKQAVVCYAYLRDVAYRSKVSTSASETKSPSTSTAWPFNESEFKKSKWFTRGWTLQELIAPRQVVFYSGDWKPLGTKGELRLLVSSITGIEEAVLAGGTLEHMSVARKMSWAADRETTRQEDLAYCLMGIFSVNMPLLYGEGKKAFIRLQEQIIARTDDQSIFAWKLPKKEAEERSLYGLLANSPKAFAKTGKEISLLSATHRKKQTIKVVNSSLEARVLLRNVPIYYYSRYGSGFKSGALNFYNPYYSAILDCQMGTSGDSWCCIDMVQLYPEEERNAMTLARINPASLSSISLRDNFITKHAFYALYGGESPPSESWHKLFLGFALRFDADQLSVRGSPASRWYEHDGERGIYAA